MRYILITVAGASDHFTNTAAKEIKIIAIASNNGIDFFI